MLHIPVGPDGGAPSVPAAPGSHTHDSSLASAVAASLQLYAIHPFAAHSVAHHNLLHCLAEVHCIELPPAPGFAVWRHTHMDQGCTWLSEILTMQMCYWNLPCMPDPGLASCSQAPPPKTLFACRTSPVDDSVFWVDIQLYIWCMTKELNKSKQIFMSVSPVVTKHCKEKNNCVNWLTGWWYHLQLQVHHLLMECRFCALDLLDPLEGGK